MLNRDPLGSIRRSRSARARSPFDKIDTFVVANCLAWLFYTTANQCGFRLLVYIHRVVVGPTGGELPSLLVKLLLVDTTWYS